MKLVTVILSLLVACNALATNSATGRKPNSSSRSCTGMGLSLDFDSTALPKLKLKDRVITMTYKSSFAAQGQYQDMMVLMADDGSYAQLMQLEKSKTMADEGTMETANFLVFYNAKKKTTVSGKVDCE